MKVLVIGKPIKHSLSPLIHNFWMKKYNLDLTYSKMEVEESGLSSIIDDIRKKKIIGVNVTLPYKKKIIRFLDDVSQSVKDSGAVNTIFLKKGKVTGENTDGRGFVRSMEKDMQIKFKNKSVYIIGAGGASYGIITELIKKQVKVIDITNRTQKKTDDLIDYFKQTNVEFNNSTWPELKPKSHTDIIINTSSFGMKKGELLKINCSNLRSKTIFSDIIYNPKETETKKFLKEKGYKTTNGLGMLIEQAAVSFNLWFNISLTEKDIKEVREICEASY